jgi:hypothetical protein
MEHFLVFDRMEQHSIVVNTCGLIPIFAVILELKIPEVYHVFGRVFSIRAAPGVHNAEGHHSKFSIVSFY